MLPSGLVIIVSLVATTFSGANGEPLLPVSQGDVVMV
jgi:hypothetical protein